ncbi:hypothetical protein MRX96_058189 [Rhipicephalus microplus]
MQLSLDASESTLPYESEKYPFSNMLPVPSTNLMFNIPLFHYGLKERSVDKQEELFMRAHQLFMVTRPTIHGVHRPSLVIVGPTRVSKPVPKSQPNDAQTHTQLRGDLKGPL